jgi:type IV pilus assembly protein PilA
MKFKSNKHKSKIIKHRKKQGFTLIEVIAVIAIIGILTSVILPRVNGYIKEAKKVKVVDQCRKVVMAVESYDLRNTVQLSDTMSISDVISNVGVSKYLEGVRLDNLVPENTSLGNCYEVLNGAEFELIEDTDKLDSQTITLGN